MACSCKKKVNEKYLEDGQSHILPEKESVLGKIGNAIFQFFFGLVISTIMIVGLIPACCYIIFCVCTGKEMEARIPNLSKWLKK